MICISQFETVWVCSRSVWENVLAHGGEVIANLGQQTPDLMNAATKAGIPGVRGNGGGSSNSGNVHVELSLGKKMPERAVRQRSEISKALVRHNKKGQAL